VRQADTGHGLRPSSLGAGHVLWIALQLVFLPGVSWLHLLYGAIGLSLVVLPLTTSARTDLAVQET
jgi:hypothetical protein